jgi:hypothetical protein
LFIIVIIFKTQTKKIEKNNKTTAAGMPSSSLFFFHFFVNPLANKRIAVAAPYLYSFNHMQQTSIQFSHLLMPTTLIQKPL